MHRTERNGKTFLLYFTFTALCALFFFLGNNYEPFALALLFAFAGTVLKTNSVLLFRGDVRRGAQR